MITADQVEKAMSREQSTVEVGEPCRDCGCTPTFYCTWEGKPRFNGCVCLGALPTERTWEDVAAFINEDARKFAAMFGLPAPNPNQGAIDGLRTLADFLEATPDMNGPVSGLTYNIFASTPEEFARLARLIGKAEKRSISTYIYLVKQFGSAVTLELNCEREKVCTKVKIGEKTVAAKPAEPEHVEEIYEWQCPPSLLAISE